MSSRHPVQLAETAWMAYQALTAFVVEYGQVARFSIGFACLSFRSSPSDAPRPLLLDVLMLIQQRMENDDAVCIDDHIGASSSFH
jgi:hypothetical protein